MFIINAPWMFTGVWAIVKGFLDERTRNKIKILGGGYKKDLHEIADPQMLPDFLGGTCKCEHIQGGCMYSNAGPWNNYDMISPYKVHKKGTYAIEGLPSPLAIEGAVTTF